MKNVSHALIREKDAAKSLLSHLRETGEDDAEIIETAIEGETNLLEAISAALAEIDECDILDAGLSAKIAAFTDRRSAVRKRSDILRAAIEQSMLVCEQESLRLPAATLSLRKIKPAVVIQTEAEIPSRFWTPQDPPAPKLNKKSLLEALEAGEEVPGACLDNGSVSLTVRRK